MSKSQKNYTIPRLPEHISLSGRALARLLNGEHLSHFSFQHSTCSYRLSADNHVLRKAGWRIDDQWHACKTNDPASHNARYKKYFISEMELERLYTLDRQRLKAIVGLVKRNEGRA